MQILVISINFVLAYEGDDTNCPKDSRTSRQTAGERIRTQVFLQSGLGAAPRDRRIESETKRVVAIGICSGRSTRSETGQLLRSASAHQVHLGSRDLGTFTRDLGSVHELSTHTRIVCALEIHLSAGAVEDYPVETAVLIRLVTDSHLT